MNIIKIISDLIKNLFEKTTQDNSDNFNNPENQETMSQTAPQIVRLGHYKDKSGGMSEDSIRMIRVIANDPENPDMWILSDGSKKSTYDILNKYEYMYTSNEENPRKPLNPLKIGDLGGIPENFGSRTNDLNPKTTTSPDIIPETHQQAPQVVEKVVEKRIELEQQIIDKCETLEKHQYTLQITVETNLDFIKLKTSIDILGLDKSLVAKYVLEKLQKNPNNDINKMVSDAIVSSILEPKNEPETYPETQQAVVTEVPQEEVPILYGLSGQISDDSNEESNMGDIDDFLEHLENNYTRLNQ